MSKRSMIPFALAPLLMTVSGLLQSPMPAIAQADTKELLVQDFKAFRDRCPGVPSSYSPSCADELAQLARRQQALHLSDSDLEAAAVKGGFRGGFR